MRIIVCVKQVIDTAARIEIKKGKVDGARLAKVLNPYDEFAVEEAVRIKERKPNTEITLVTLGPEHFQDALRAGLSMGCDNAVHLKDPSFDMLDSLAAARLIAKAITLLGFDLIFCGRQAVDDDMAQIGPALAVYLGIPCVTVVTQLEFINDWKQAKATRQIEGGFEVIEAPLPTLVTCQKGLNEPRLPSFKGIMAAKKKPIQILDGKKICLAANETSEKTSVVIQNGLELPPLRAKGVIIDGSPNETISKLAKTLREIEKVV